HWICLSDFAVADQDGVAVLNVNEGADVESLDLYIGSGLNADGTIVIADVATDWDMRGSLYVGQNANLAATLTIRDGASMTLDSAFIADGDNTTGVVELVGPGCSFQTDGSFSLGVGTGLGAFSCSDDDTVVIGGDYFQNDASSLTVSISSLVDAPIIVGGNAILGGTLNLVLEPGFETPLGTEYQLMTAASVSDAFIVVNQDAMPSGNFFIVSYEPTRVRLIVVDEIIPGDVNYNGTVDVTDLLKLLEAWGSCPGCNEDVNGDGVVSVLDLLTLLASWT
ncbi:MAG: dockerin type I domain-containing protein, partial [Planctomycetota bacterium]|nr:dockerin type I domain-containing protein [Planctomycetota bacterium]